MSSAKKPGGTRPKKTKRAGPAAAKKAPKRRAAPAAGTEVREAAASAAAHVAGAADRAASQTPSASAPAPRAHRAADGTIVIEQYASGIGCPVRQKMTLRALGLRRPRQRVVRPDNPAVRGMVNAIPHLVRIVEGDRAA
jgi:large subunit ribosomal protein L30